MIACVCRSLYCIHCTIRTFLLLLLLLILVLNFVHITWQLKLTAASSTTTTTIEEEKEAKNVCCSTQLVIEPFVIWYSQTCATASSFYTSNTLLQYRDHTPLYWFYNRDVLLRLKNRVTLSECVLYIQSSICIFMCFNFFSLFFHFLLFSSLHFLRCTCCKHHTHKHNTGDINHEVGVLVCFRVFFLPFQLNSKSVTLTSS